MIFKNGFGYLRSFLRNCHKGEESQAWHRPAEVLIPACWLRTNLSGACCLSCKVWELHFLLHMTRHLVNRSFTCSLHWGSSWGAFGFHFSFSSFGQPMAMNTPLSSWHFSYWLFSKMASASICSSSTQCQLPIQSAVWCHCCSCGPSLSPKRSGLTLPGLNCLGSSSFCMPLEEICVCA